MRRRRQVLQVSTFPFLAVLLCAMGSLILLLLVIDRRARVVARARAVQALERVDAEAARQAEAARRAAELRATAERAEWERRRQALHNQLVQDDEGLLNQLRKIEAQARSAVERTQSERARTDALRGKLQAERARLAQVEATLTARRTGVARKAEETTLSQEELARLARELDLMERTVADLKALRQRQQETYSLVPYRGRSGDNRRPIYVECAANGLVFHPEGNVLRGADMTLGSIRDEVERRIAAQRLPLAPGSQPVTQKPYLLMLIRPDGIESYGRTLVALQGVSLDFGYEFIDADWVLDFPKDDQTPASQPWMIAQQTTASRPAPPALRPSTTAARLVGLRSSLTAPLVNEDSREQESPAGDRPAVGPGTRSASHTRLAGQGYVSGRGDGGSPGRMSMSGNAAGHSGAGESGTGKGSGHAQAVASTGSIVPGRNGNGNAGGSGPGGRGGSNTGPSGPGTSPGTGASAGGTGGGLPGLPMRREGGSAGVRAAGPGNGNPGEGPTGLDSRNPGVPSASSGPVGTPDNDPQGTSAGGAGGRPRTPPVPSVMPGTFQPLGDHANPGGADNPTGVEGVAEHRGSPAGVSRAIAAAAPPGGGVPADGRPATGATVGTGVTGAPASGRGGGSGGEQGAENVGDGPPKASGSANPLLAGSVAEPRKGPRPPRVALALGSREWDIWIECTPDALVVYPSRLRFPTATMTGDGADSPLTQAVRQMIARKQATVRAGDPPYEPRIRFLLRPSGGLRSYYQSYPLLQGLQVPMARDNLEADEDVYKHMYGH